MKKFEESSNNWLKGLRVERLKEGTKAIRHEGNKVVKKSALVKSCGNCLTLKNLSPYCPIALSPSKRVAFTMSEILISLTIIGIIAAITLPSLIGNMNEKTFAAKRKALYSRMSQAISMMPSLNGYGVGENDTQTAQNATQAFITDGLSKVLKISNICDNENLKKCGFPDKFTKMGTNSKMNSPKKLTDLNRDFNNPNGTYVNYSQIDTNSAAFETVNGESILTFYNPNCSYTYGVNNKDGSQNLMQPTMCANFIYDLNGRKGPNKVGKDIGFMTAFYPTDTEVVAPMPAGALMVYKDAHPVFSIGIANASCRTEYGEDAKMANIEELKAIYTNNKLGGNGIFIQSTTHVSSTMISSISAYSFVGQTGGISAYTVAYYWSSSMWLICVRK